MDATPRQPLPPHPEELQPGPGTPADLTRGWTAVQGSAVDSTDSTSPEPSSQSSPAPSVLHSIFFGRFGLRAGYGITIFLTALAALLILSGFAALAATGHLHQVMAARAEARAHPNAPHPKLNFNLSALYTIASDGVWFLGLLGVCWLLSSSERRPLRVYGIGRHRVADLVPGSLWGVVSMSALVLALRGLHLLVFDSRALNGAAIFIFGTKWLLAFLLVGLAEEYSFRGYLQYTIMRGVWGLAERISPSNVRAVAFWIAATTLALLFAGVHTGNQGETAFGIAQVFLAGMVFSYALWRTGSLWWGIGFHTTWDWAQSFLFGVADSGNVSAGRLFITHPAGRSWLSGGAAGPEGSVFASVALLLTLLVIRLARPGVQPALEPEPKRAPEFQHSLA